MPISFRESNHIEQQLNPLSSFAFTSTLWDLTGLKLIFELFGKVDDVRRQQSRAQSAELALQKAYVLGSTVQCLVNLLMPQEARADSILQDFDLQALQCELHLGPEAPCTSTRTSPRRPHL